MLNLLFQFYLPSVLALYRIVSSLVIAAIAYALAYLFNASDFNKHAINANAEIYALVASKVYSNY